MSAADPAESPTLEQRPPDSGQLLASLTDAPPAPEIARLLAPKIAEHLERAAWWPEHELRKDWKLGESSKYTIAFKGRDYQKLYVQFFSEPHCEAVLEVTSSQNDPDLDATAPDDVKDALTSRGFRPGGGRAGFLRSVRVESAEGCQALAEEIVGLMTDGLAWDPRGPINYYFSLDQCARPELVYHALSLSDLARLLRSSGLVVWELGKMTGGPGFHTVDRPRFQLLPYSETAKGSGRYRALWFTFSTRFEPERAETVLQKLGPGHAFGEMCASDDGRLSITQAVTLAGGVTEAHLRSHLQRWRWLLKRVVELGRPVEDDEDD